MMRAALRLAAGTVSLATGGWVLRALHGAPAALGAQPADIHAVADRSPNFQDGVFVNLEPASMNIGPDQGRSLLWEIITGLEDARPSAEIPLDTPEPRTFDAPAGQIAVSWFGHSTALLEIDGYRVLTDPVWSERCSPSDVIGPGRMHLDGQGPVGGQHLEQERQPGAEPGHAVAAQLAVRVGGDDGVQRGGGQGGGGQGGGGQGGSG